MTVSVKQATVPVGSDLSMFHPVYLGIDEFGQPVYITLVYKNLLVGGQPGGGKSALIQNVLGHAALSSDTSLVLFDGKLVELGLYKDIADVFVGKDIRKAIVTLRRIQRVIDNRCAWMDAHGRRQIRPEDGLNVLVGIIDELAFYTTIAGTKAEQEEFMALLTDIVARGRACAVVMVIATQRPSGANNPPIITASLRDNIGYRHASKTTTHRSSDLILGEGWAEDGYSAANIADEDQGVGLLLAERGVPRLMKSAYMTDDQIKALVDYAAWTRRRNTIPDPTEVARVLPMKEVA